MISKESFIKAMKLINAESNRQDELWNKLENSYINVDKLIQEINISPMIEMLAEICDCSFETIADCVYGNYNNELVEKIYDYICECNECL